MLNPSVSFSGYKESGKGYFGGKEGSIEILYERRTDFIFLSLGLNEYLTRECICTLKKLDISLPNEETTLINTISASKKAQESWCKSSLKDRIQRFKSAADSYSEKYFHYFFLKSVIVLCFFQWS